MCCRLGPYFPVRRLLLLVPQNERLSLLRQTWKMAFLGLLRGRQRRLLSDAFFGRRWDASTLCRLPGRLLGMELCVFHRLLYWRVQRASVFFRYCPRFLEKRKSTRQSMGCGSNNT